MKIQNAFRVGLVGALGVGLAIFIIAAVTNLATLITYIGAALFLALGLEPAITWLEKRKLPRWGAILIVIAAVAAVAAGLLLSVIPIIVSQVGQLVSRIPALVSNLSSQAWVEQTLSGIQKQFPLLNVRNIWKGVSDGVVQFFSDPNKLSDLAGGVWQVTVSIGSGVFGVVIVVILTLYFAASLNSIKRSGYLLVPASKRARFEDLTEQITASVGRYVTGQVSLAAINGIASFIFLSIIAAPFSAVLAFVAFIFSLIPLVGTLTGSAIIVLTCLIPGLGSPLTALVAAIYYIIYMQIEAYILSPRIMNRAVKVPGVLVIIAALIGGQLLGILGALIAIPVAASVLLIIKQVVVPRQAAR